MSDRPVDLGFAEGRLVGFAPSGAVGPPSFPIGGSRPAQAPSPKLLDRPASGQ